MKKLLLSFIMTFGITTCTFAAANAGIEQTVTSGETVYLDGTESVAEYSENNLSYRWHQLYKRISTIVSLENANAATASFIAPEVNETTQLSFRLKTIELYDCDTDRSTYRDSKHSHVRHKHHKFQRSKRCQKFISFDDVNIFVLPSESNASNNNDDNDTGILIQGIVTDINGTAIVGATVTTQGQTVTTDINGFYTLNHILDAERVTIDVIHPNYLSNSRIVKVTDQNISLDITLGAPKATATFDTNTGTILKSSDGASVSLPADGYVDENGNRYNGTVTVKMSYYPITTQSGRATFPGTFEGIDENGESFPIVSYGFMNVELTDANGNPINLDGNVTATLTFPQDNTLYSPSVTPLWYYDETLGYWVEEGEAVRQNDYTYIGTVKHFTSWNLDAKGPRATFKGCVEDKNGTKIANAQVQFRAINWDSYTVPTDENGSISVYNILADTDLTFSAYIKIGSTYYYGDKSIYLNEGEDKVDDSCVVVKPQNSLPGTVTVTGTLVTSSWDNGTIVYTPEANQTVHVYTTIYPYEILATSTTADDGTFSMTFETLDAIKYGVGASYPATTFLLQNKKSDYDLGVVQDHSNDDEWAQ